MASSQHRCVFVGNIPYDATEEQLIQICEEVGPVVSFRLVIDRETGKPKGYGFCEYKDEETALSARRNLQGYEINGRQLRVDFAENDKNADRNREQGRGGPGMTSNADSQKQLGGPAILGDSALHQPIGLPLAMTAASVMAGALGGVQSGSNSLTQNGLQTQSGLGNDPLTHYLAKMSKNQLYQVMSELKVMAIQNKEIARQLLLVSPQLPKALFQVQIILGMVTPQMLQMPNLQQSAGSLLHPPLRDGQHGQQIAVPYSRQPPLVPKAGQLGLPRAQDVQVSSVPQNILVNNQVPTLPLQQVPVQPQYQHPQLAQSHLLPQKAVSGQSGVSAIPPVHPQSLNAFSVRPQNATSATSPALKQQVLAPLLQHPGQAGVTSLGNNTQLASNPHNSYLHRPQSSQLSLQDISMTAKDLSRFAQGTDDATLIPRSNAYSSFPLGLSEKTSGVGDGSELMHRPSKLARLEDGRKASSMTSLNGSNMTASLTQVFGAGSLSANQVPNAGVQQNEKQTPQLQLLPEVESALLQQVMNLTAEQLSSLPPEQQQQVIQLQQMLR